MTPEAVKRAFHRRFELPRNLHQETPLCAGRAIFLLPELSLGVQYGGFYA